MSSTSPLAARMSDLPIITIPPSLPHTHTVIFLHGRGGTARNFTESISWSHSSTGRGLLTSFPTIRFVFPEAKPRPWDRCPQWFDIWNVENLEEREDVQIPGLRESVELLVRVVRHEVELLGGHWERLVLAGISQGAATAVHTLLNLDIPSRVDENGNAVPRRLGGLLCFAARMPFPNRTLSVTRGILNLPDAPSHDEVIRQTPILLEHCVDDHLVPVERGRGLRDTLRRFGADVSWKEYEWGSHWFNSPHGIDDAMDFLEATLGVRRVNTVLVGP